MDHVLEGIDVDDDRVEHVEGVFDRYLYNQSYTSFQLGIGVLFFTASFTKCRNGFSYAGDQVRPEGFSSIRWFLLPVFSSFLGFFRSLPSYSFHR